jgi:hypothetical protein
MQRHSTLSAMAVLYLTAVCYWLSFVTAEAKPYQLTPLAEISGFSAWRPYSNPSRLVNLGMNKGQVFAIAGKPDREEAYYSGNRGGLIQISDWYYIRTGHDPETTLLKFTQDTLVSIVTTPTP